jgi:hypothetical protein
MDPPPGRRSSGVSRRRALTVAGAAVAAVGTSVLASPSVNPDGGNDGSAEGTPDDDAGPFARLHRRGVTGEGVRVGVLDPTGFDPNHESLSGRVRRLRRFGGGTLGDSGVTHGTASAATVAESAPGATLSLASFGGPEGFRSAMAWLRAAATDVLLAPVAAHGVAATGTTPLVDAAARTVAAGTSVVAPAGNAAEGHWQGPYAAVTDDGSEERRYLLVRSLSRGAASGRFVGWLHTERIDIDPTLALLELTGDPTGPELVAVSRPSAVAGAERVGARLDDATYALVVRSKPSTSVSASVRTQRVEIATPTHRLAPARPAGSIAAPANAPGVLAVGAFDGTGVPAYSGRGPTVDGRPGVDVVAAPRPWAGPRNPGTSAAAARVAGVAALLKGVAPELGPSAVTDTIAAAAASLDAGTPRSTGGAGALAPVAAVQRARARRDDH